MSLEPLQVSPGKDMGERVDLANRSSFILPTDNRPFAKRDSDPRSPKRCLRCGCVFGHDLQAAVCGDQPARRPGLRGGPVTRCQDRSLGSSASRSESPSQLKLKTATEMAAPGTIASHGALFRNVRPELII